MRGDRQDGSKDGSKEGDETIVNHFHGVSSSSEAHRDVCGQTDPGSWIVLDRESGGSRMFRGGSALEGEVTDTDEFDTVTDEIRRWSSLSADEYQRFVEDGVLNDFEMMW